MYAHFKFVLFYFISGATDKSRFISRIAHARVYRRKVLYNHRKPRIQRDRLSRLSGHPPPFTGCVRFIRVKIQRLLYLIQILEYPLYETSSGLALGGAREFFSVRPFKLAGPRNYEKFKNIFEPSSCI